jgi:hypothetical protein
VAAIHGFLFNKGLYKFVLSTNYSVRELYTLFARFKALCSLSSTPTGVDREAFRLGVPMLSVEDDLFVDRVFEVLDEDGSGVIEFEEFIEAMSALERGTREKRTDFLFQVVRVSCRACSRGPGRAGPGPARGQAASRSAASCRR